MELEMMPTNRAINEDVDMSEVLKLIQAQNEKIDMVLEKLGKSEGGNCNIDQIIQSATLEELSVILDSDELQRQCSNQL